MANLIFPKAKEALLQGAINLSSATVKAVFLDGAEYTYSAVHDNLDDVAAPSRVGTPQTITGKTFTNGVFDGGDVTFTALTGDVSEFILIYVDSGVESTSTLLALIDTGTGLPVTPTGATEIVQFHASGIFAL